MQQRRPTATRAETSRDKSILTMQDFQFLKKFKIKTKNSAPKVKLSTKKQKKKKHVLNEPVCYTLWDKQLQSTNSKYSPQIQQTIICIYQLFNKHFWITCNHKLQLSRSQEPIIRSQYTSQAQHLMTCCENAGSSWPGPPKKTLDFPHFPRVP